MIKHNIATRKQLFCIVLLRGQVATLGQKDELLFCSVLELIQYLRPVLRLLKAQTQRRATSGAKHEGRVALELAEAGAGWTLVWTETGASIPERRLQRSSTPSGRARGGGQWTMSHSHSRRDGMAGYLADAPGGPM